jgi:hypothetical protein
MLAGGHPLPGNLSRTAPKAKGLDIYFVRVGRSVVYPVKNGASVVKAYAKHMEGTS